jgi:hypothetical protein
VLGRALSFSDPEIVRMASEDFVPAVGDDWYQRRRQDAAGRFFRKVADQGPRKGDGTRQGIYALTADGQLLAYKNAGQAPDVMRAVLRAALAAWRKLPEDRRRPGAVAVPREPSEPDAAYDRTPPPGGLVVKTFTRALERPEPGGDPGASTCDPGGGGEAARDHLWLRPEDWRPLVPDDPRPGQTLSVPEKLVARIARYHLVDNTRGEPPFWEPEHVRKAELTITIASVTPGAVRLRLDGAVLLSTSADPSQSERGYDARLLGHLTYDCKADALTRFDAVALGDHWGEGRFTPDARPGRAPLGVAFLLADGYERCWGDIDMTLSRPRATRNR